MNEQTGPSTISVEPAQYRRKIKRGLLIGSGLLVLTGGAMIAWHWFQTGRILPGPSTPPTPASTSMDPAEAEAVKSGLRLKWRKPGESGEEANRATLETLRPGVIRQETPETDKTADQPILATELSYVERTKLQADAEKTLLDFQQAPNDAAKAALTRKPAQFAETTSQLNSAGRVLDMNFTPSQFDCLRKGELDFIYMKGDIQDSKNPREAIFTKNRASKKVELDLEASLGISEFSWKRALETKPSTPFLIRAYASLSDYYNFEFSDKELLQSVKLQDPVTNLTLYGFCRRGGDIESRIQRWLDPRWGREQDSVTLRVAFSASAAGPDCVEIVEWVTSGWIVP